MDFPSSCLALNDLIRGRQADDLIDHLAEIWETLFRVLDDIKVSLKLSQKQQMAFVNISDTIEIKISCGADMTYTQRITIDMLQIGMMYFSWFCNVILTLTFWISGICEESGRPNTEDTQ